MSLRDLLTMAWRNILGHRMRTLLTIMGIAIGIGVVLSVVAVGQGGRSFVMDKVDDLGTNSFIIRVNYQNDTMSRQRFIKLSDIDAVKSLVPGVESLAPIRPLQFPVRGTRGKSNVWLIGTTPDYAVGIKLQERWGHFLRNNDQERVMVLDQSAARQLFGPGNPTNQRVKLAVFSFVVSGVVANNSLTQMLGVDKTAYLPISFMQRVGMTDIDMLYGTAGTGQPAEVVMNKCVRILERRHSAANRYEATSMQQTIQMANLITMAIELVIALIAGISLLVGGIGVMNIMLVSINERTREVGIRMALGAEPRDILRQFLVESVVLCGFGGLAGLLLGYIGASQAETYTRWPVSLSAWAVLLALGFSSLVGIAFGIYPAYRASRLNPIEALRSN